MKITINEGASFLITDPIGDIIPGSELGLYNADTRFLRNYQLTINGTKPTLLSAKQVDYYSALHHLTNPPIADIPQGTLSISRRRFVGDGLHEDIDISNHSLKPVVLTLQVEYDSDFADIFEVKTKSVMKSGTFTVEHNKKTGSFAFNYSRGDFIRKIIFEFSQKPKLTKDRIALFTIELAPSAKWHLCIDYFTLTSPEKKPIKYTCKSNIPIIQSKETELDHWRAAAPKLTSDYDSLNHAYAQSLDDLAALRLQGKDLSEEEFLFAAGVPWFMTFFGRDSLITSYQTLLTFPEFATGALRTLAKYQGKRIDNYTEEEPGKILHEIRFGELATLGEIPHTPYYGTIDATLLWLILLSQTFRWTGDKKLLTDLKNNMLKALAWIDDFGDMDSDGYIEYLRKTDKGLANQGWKDSKDAVRFADGHSAAPPIALCEVQGYAYDAKLRSAELLAILGESRKAAKLISEAENLKKKFNQDFWMEEEGFFAQALDKSKKKVNAITSNAGQLLWSGIVEPKKAEQVVKRLFADDMFSGWGIRTLSSNNSGYNPISYHNGSVWPHDNSLIVTGLIKYGFYAEAKKIMSGITSASAYFDKYRLPELFCGFSRKESSYPADYPTSSSPQAWSAGATSLLITAMLGLDINVAKKRIRLRPILPDSINHLKIENIKVGSSTLGLYLSRDKKKINVDIIQEPQGFEIKIGG